MLLFAYTLVLFFAQELRFLLLKHLEHHIRVAFDALCFSQDHA